MNHRASTLIAAGLLSMCALALPQGEMLSPRYAHSATLLDDGRVLIYGGLGPGFVAGNGFHDPDTGETCRAPRGHKIRAFHTATRLGDGSVLVAGGFILPYSTSRTAELFDGRRFVFLQSKMSAPRELHAATLLADGRVLITGGFVGGVTSLAKCDIYEPASRKFSPAADMSVSRFGHAACVLPDGRVLVTGGSQFPDEKTLASAQIYDPAADEFSDAGPMLADRSRHTATVLPDGRVFITGGNSISTKGQLRSTELYDPGTGESSPGPDMSEPRMDHTATLLPDGRVLITGGFTGQGGLHTIATCEVYDPETNAFTRVADLPHPVHEHKATLLPDGSVLVTGGLAVKGEKQGVSPQAFRLCP